MTQTLRAALALTLMSLVALLGAGCGSSSGSGSETAKVAPPGSFLYFEATIDPSGDQESAMRSILGDLPGEGPPEGRLDALIQKASQAEKDSKVDYMKDVKPWLGDTAAVFVSGPVDGEDIAAALVIATTDEDAAIETLDKAADGKGQKKTYRDVDYTFEGDTARAIVGGFAVFGSEPGMKAAIDASKGESLSEADRYKKATEDVSDERVALLYEDLSGILKLASGAAGESLGPVAPLLGRLFGSEPIVATIRAEQQALVMDGSLAPKSSLINFFGASTPLLGDVPADAWLSVGQSDLGAQIKKLVGLFGGFAGGEEALYDEVRRQTGIDVDRDVLAWMGDVALFVHGDSKETVGGGALIQSKDPEASERALTKLAAAIERNDPATQIAAARIDGATGYQLRDPSMPKPIYMVQSDDKVALTYGEDAAKSALADSEKLSASAEYTRATRALGAGYAPSLYVAVPPILALAESFGAREDEDYGKARPYLTILDHIVSGSAKGDEKVSSRSRVGFKPHE